MPDMFRKRKVLLAFGGGAARGMANIGVIKVLEEEGIPIDFMIGSSMGALVASSYALGMKVPQLIVEAEHFTWKDIADITFPKIAMLKGERLAGTITRLTQGKTFSDTRIPIAITATDILSGEEVIFTEGNLQKIVQASCSWPGFFPPVAIDGRLLGDGGMRNSVPVKWAKQFDATYIIAVRVGFSPQNITGDNIFQLMIQSIQIMGEELDKYQSMSANVVIAPEIGHVNQIDFHLAPEIIHKGEEATRQVVKKIKKDLGLR